MMSGQELHFHKCNSDDLNELQEISESTFAEAFAHLNNPADFQQYLSQAFSLEKLSSELANEDSAFYFCYHNQSLVGYLKLNFSAAQTDIHDLKSLEIERIYVLKGWQGKGIGMSLLKLSVEVARAHALKYIWLGAWEKNPRAISFYKRFGFEPFDKHSFHVGSDLQTDILMRLSLSDPDI